MILLFNCDGNFVSVFFGLYVFISFFCFFESKDCFVYDRVDVVFFNFGIYGFKLFVRVDVYIMDSVDMRKGFENVVFGSCIVEEFNDGDDIFYFNSV